MVGGFSGNEHRIMCVLSMTNSEVLNLIQPWTPIAMVDLPPIDRNNIFEILWTLKESI